MSMLIMVDLPLLKCPPNTIRKLLASSFAAPSVMSRRTRSSSSLPACLPRSCRNFLLSLESGSSSRPSACPAAARPALSAWPDETRWAPRHRVLLPADRGDLVAAPARRAGPGRAARCGVRGAPAPGCRARLGGRRDSATTVLPDLKGLRYLHQLLRRPGADVSALGLAAAATGHGGTVVSESGGGELIDAQTLAAYRLRLRDIDIELAEAESWADQARLGQLRLEREALLHEVGAATGLACCCRRFGSADERARVAVRKAIAAALACIENHDPALARLLRYTARTGATCRYDPDPGSPRHLAARPAPATTTVAAAAPARHRSKLGPAWSR